MRLLIIAFALSGCSLLDTNKESIAYYESMSDIAKLQQELAKRPVSKINCSAGCSIEIFDPSRVPLPHVQKPTTGYDAAIAVLPDIFKFGSLTYGAIRVTDKVMNSVGSGNTSTTYNLVNTAEDNNTIEINSFKPDLSRQSSVTEIIKDD